MAPRSPTQAFDPTPALEHNPHYSPFNGLNGVTQRHFSLGNGGDYPGGTKEVRFLEPPSSVHGRHSIATSNVPLLPPVPSASHVPKQAFRITNPMPGVDITAYFEQCRNVNEQMRLTHEHERKAWDIERTALRTRIADLEFKFNKAKDTKRRLSNEPSAGSNQSFQSDFRIGQGYNFPANGFRPVSAPLGPTTQGLPPVWQTESPRPATRVFANEDDVSHLPSISEDEPSKDLEGLSPLTSRESVPIPIQHIDDSLDGITVKSEGVKSSFVKVLSPIITSPIQSPSTQPEPEPGTLKLDTNGLLDPLDKKLKLHAGHTPLAVDGDISTGISTEGELTPREEQPKDPAPTKRPPLRPSEKSDSYFSTEDIHLKDEETTQSRKPSVIAEDAEPLMEPEDDKPLTGPLMLDPKGKSEASNVFLEKLDDKLAEVVRISQTNSPVRSPPNEPPKPPEPQEDEGPVLKLKQTTNFGSAYGLAVPGRGI